MKFDFSRSLQEQSHQQDAALMAREAAQLFKAQQLPVFDVFCQELLTALERAIAAQAEKLRANRQQAERELITVAKKAVLDSQFVAPKSLPIVKDTPEVLYLVTYQAALWRLCQEWPLPSHHSSRPSAEMLALAKILHALPKRKNLRSLEIATELILQKLNIATLGQQTKVLADELSFMQAGQQLAEQTYQNLQQCLRKAPRTAQRLIYQRKKFQVALGIFTESDALMTLQTTIDRLETQSKPQLALRKALIQLQNELYQQLSAAQSTASLSSQMQADYKRLATALKIMVDGILISAPMTNKLALIDRTEQTIRQLTLLQKPAWQRLGRYVVCVLIAAVGAALGCVLGASVYGGVLALLSAPAGGVAGIFGLVAGAVHGSITGWTLGLATATSLTGIACGLGSAKIGSFFIGRDRLADVKRAARQVARSRFHEFFAETAAAIGIAPSAVSLKLI